MAEDVKFDNDNVDVEINENDTTSKRHHHSMEKLSYAERGRFFKLRQVINFLFIVLAIAGMAVYYFSDTTIGGLLLLTGVLFKICECVLRIMH